MITAHGTFICLLIAITGIVHLCTSCDINETRQGCKIESGQCICGYGCVTEFRYETRTECVAALKGRRRDICSAKPCLNQGQCIQVSQHPGFKCRCEGTGFYGSRCERNCPSADQALARGTFPYECVVI